MPSKAQILSYWANDLIENDKYWMEAIYEDNCTPKMIQSVCFACGYQGGTERCHIVPKVKGGGDGVDNLHLLCKSCHVESEYIVDYEAYMDWLDMKTPETSTSWIRVQNSVATMTKQIGKGRLDLVPDWLLKSLLTVYKDTESLIEACKHQNNL
jgi:hypothetical protein